MRLAGTLGRACLGVLVVGLAYAFALGAAAAAPASTRGGVLRADTSDYPAVVVRVSPRKPPSLTPVAVPTAAFTLTENGTRRDISVAAVSTEGLEVVLLVDASRSGDAAGGGPVISAAVEFVLRLNEASVGIVGFGGEPEVIIPLTDDRAELVAALGTVRSGQGLDLAGALPLALEQFSADGAGHQVLVVLSATPDAGGSMSVEEAAAALAAGDVTFYAVHAGAREGAVGALDRLAAAASGPVLSRGSSGARRSP